MGRWISCPARSKVDCLITLLFHRCAAITTNAFFMIFCTSVQKRRRGGREREGEREEIQIDRLPVKSVFVIAGSAWINGIEGCWRFSQKDGRKNKRNWFVPLGMGLMWLSLSCCCYCCHQDCDSALKTKFGGGRMIMPHQRQEEYLGDPNLFKALRTLRTVSFPEKRTFLMRREDFSWCEERREKRGVFFSCCTHVEF